MIRNINSIQIFKSVCEARSVTRAAQELNISQSSVSYHIKKLETDLAVQLFRRTAIGLELTEEGALLATQVERGLSIIEMGLEQVINRASTVRIALLPMFASRWLSKRLGSLMEARPDLHLAIQSHNNTYAKMKHPEGFADLGIQWGRGKWDNFDIQRLWSERLVVVCSPEYLRNHPITTPADIERCTLLHVDDTRMWDEWYADRGLTLSRTQHQMMLEDRHFQLSSTINGLGISLFASWLVRNELSSGQLVDPFGEDFETSFAYHLIIPKNIEFGSATRCVSEWLLDVSRAAK